MCAIGRGLEHSCTPYLLMLMCAPIALILLLYVFAQNKVLITLSLRFGYLNIVKYLVEDQHCDVNVTDNDGQTSLHHICK